MILTADNYRSTEADLAFWSCSLLRRFEECQAMAMAELRGEWRTDPTDAMLIGSYVDAALTESTEVRERFEASHEMRKRDGTLYAKWAQAETMIDTVRRDPTAMALLAGESQVILQGEIDGHMWRGKADVIHRERQLLVDLKTCADFLPVWRTYRDAATGETRNEKTPWYDRYWFQLAMYQALLAQETSNRCLPMLVAVSKQTPPGLRGITFPQQSRLDFELSIGLANIGKHDAVRRGDIAPAHCMECDYCRSVLPMQWVVAEDYRGRGLRNRAQAAG